MPRRLRVPKSLGRLTLEDLNALGSGDEEAMTRLYGSLAAAQARWRLLKPQWPAFPGQRPEAFWIFDGPAELRTPPFERLSDDYSEEIARHKDLERRRLAWLIQTDQLDQDEIVALMQARDPEARNRQSESYPLEEL